MTLLVTQEEWALLERMKVSLFVRSLPLLCAFGIASVSLAAPPEENYPVPSESIKQEGVPEGQVIKGTLSGSAFYPGTVRDYAVYVPAQYDPAKAAALMVFQDGSSYLDYIPTVFDNLIHAGDMPITIGLFVNPGIVPALSDEAMDRFNRSFEYDTTDDRYANFIIEEVIPKVLEKWNVTTDPNLRAVCGSSSGGIAAFQMAWERPDQFRRVFTTAGTYVGLRGGHELPVLIRKIEPKPLRVFLQDGRNDLDLYAGSWWVANQDMLASLEWAGYEVNHAWGEGAHNRKHGYAIFPEAMRWLWQDWKGEGRIVRTHVNQSRSGAKDFLMEGEDWQLASSDHGIIQGLAVDGKDTLYFSDTPRKTIWRMAPGAEAEPFKEDAGRVTGLAFAPDGKTLYACHSEENRIISWDVTTGEEQVRVAEVRAEDIVIAHDGTVFFVEPRKKTLRMLSPSGELLTASSEYSGADGVTLSTDQSMVFVSDREGRYVWSGQRQSDGKMAAVQPLYHLQIPPASVETSSKARGMAVTKDGWLLVATTMGIQIADQLGRVHLIVPLPHGERPPSQVLLHENTLYVASGQNLFCRKVKMGSALPMAAPIKPPKPGL